MEKFIESIISAVCIVIVCLFFAWAIDSAVHYDGFLSAFKISLFTFLGLNYTIKCYGAILYKIFKK